MNKFKPEVFIDELEKGLGKDGDLVLIIACTKCDAQFELNSQAVALAIATEAKVIEYIRYVQSSKCPSCNKDKKDDN